MRKKIMTLPGKSHNGLEWKNNGREQFFGALLDNLSNNMNNKSNVYITWEPNELPTSSNILYNELHSNT